MFYSQYQQDKFLELNLFKGFKNGIFVDVGAHDGVNLNNTYYFEKENNWTGINIEPIKTVFGKLLVNRPKCINLNVAVSDIEGQQEFFCNTGYTEMLSGLKSTYHPRHLERLNTENKLYSGNTETILVETKRLDTICKEYKINHIHYLTIDVEGAEYSVIKSINFNDVFIDVIEFENNYNDNQVMDYLKEKNYVVFHKNLDIFMIHKNSQFLNIQS